MFIEVKSFDEFYEHPAVQPLLVDFERDYILASHAHKLLLEDLEEINRLYAEQEGRVLFTNVKGRAKEKDSFFRKLYQLYCDSESNVDQDALLKLYQKINDITGVRFSCPYVDEVTICIETFIRPSLRDKGYEVELSEESLVDRNYLEQSNKQGYQSYHFFVKVPTEIDIFGKTQNVLCEIQGRSELQHAWATKSHELIYKYGQKSEIESETLSDMKIASDLLQSVDKSLINIRDRINKRYNANEGRS